MAQYTISYQCGHTAAEQIYGTDAHGERGREAERRGARLCRDCYRTQQEQAATAQAEAQDLPALQGTEKQVAWALTIRAKLIAEIDLWYGDAQRAYATHIQARGTWPTDAERTQMAEIEAAVARLRGEPRSTYWIDHRNETGKAIVRALMAPVVRDTGRV